MILSQEGYDIDSANDGASAGLTKLNQFYDLISSDIKMPKMDGLEALEK